MLPNGVVIHKTPIERFVSKLTADLFDISDLKKVTSELASHVSRFDCKFQIEFNYCDILLTTTLISLKTVQSVTFHESMVTDAKKPDCRILYQGLVLLNASIKKIE